MIVAMKPHATAADIGAVIRKAESMGVRTHPIYGENRTVVALVGDLTHISRETFTAMDGVQSTVRIQEPYKLASRTTRPDNTVIEIADGQVRIGGQEIIVMAGPCSVESRDQVVEALLMAGTYSRYPVPCDGSTTTGRWLDCLSTGTALRSNVLRVAVS